MDNDLIKQQIESAKKAYISGMAKQHSEAFSEQNATGPTTVTNLSQFEQQSAIMARLKSLMDEAAQTPRLDKTTGGDITLPHPAYVSDDAAVRSQPFWAQQQTDIPPSERFAAHTHQQEVSMPQPPSEEDKGPVQPDIHTLSAEHIQHPHPSEQEPKAELQPASDETLQSPSPEITPSQEPAEHQEAISAIRNEVISHMENNTSETSLSPELLARIEQLETRVSKQQQDLTALLKLVRQIAARQKEAPAAENLELTEKKGGLVSTFFWIVFIIVAGSSGWLYFMNPELFQKLVETGFNQALNIIIGLAAQFGLL